MAEGQLKQLNVKVAEINSNQERSARGGDRGARRQEGLGSNVGGLRKQRVLPVRETA